MSGFNVSPFLFSCFVFPSLPTRASFLLPSFLPLQLSHSQSQSRSYINRIWKHFKGARERDRGAAGQREVVPVVMGMEVMVPVMAPSAPCSPRTAAAGMGGGGDHQLPSYCYFFASAPTSPSRASACYGADDDGGGYHPHPPGAADAATSSTFDFTFGFSGQLQESTPILAAADELFEGGRIRPLNNPHPSILRLVDGDGDGDAPVFPRSPRRSRTARARAGAGEDQREVAAERGRSGRPAPTSTSSSVPSSRSRRETRSLSPFRGGAAVDDEFSSPPTSPRGASLLRGCGASGSRKWRLKDLFLFRSASEGRAAGAAGGKDPLLKYTMLKSGSDGAGNVSMRKARGSAASASDMPYTVSRAAAEELRRRTTTPLPFHRNSLFGYLRSNPAIHSISRKLSSYASSNRGRPSSSTATTAAA